MTYGDRLFRAKNWKRATQRYEQAIHANPGSAAPRVRLSQVALVRGDFTAAVNRLREAQATDPEWLEHPDDVEGLFAEPGDFHDQIAKLESHLQTQPKDRDAWLLLGAEWFLSGRTRPARDIFLRLTDRKADAILAAFLDASQPADPDPPQAEARR